MLARKERDAFCALLVDKGPDAPTLCEGWTTRELAAHAVLREHRPDAMVGLRIARLAGHTANVQRNIAAKHSYPQLIDTIRHGPPRLSIFKIPVVDEHANAMEFYVHGEDVRRCVPGWDVRKLDPALEEMLWNRVTHVAKLLLRRAPCGVELRREGRTDTPLLKAKDGMPMVTVSGPPGELILWVLGRKSAAQVRLDGDPATVAKLNETTWRL